MRGARSAPHPLLAALQIEFYGIRAFRPITTQRQTVTV